MSYFFDSLSYLFCGTKTNAQTVSSKNAYIDRLKTIKRDATNEKIMIAATIIFALLSVAFMTLSALSFLKFFPISAHFLLPTTITYAALSAISAVAFSFTTYSLVGWDRVIDRRHLLIGTKRLDYSLEDWHLNAALLRSYYDDTDDVELKKLIAFLGNNYLGKVTSVPTHHAVWESLLGGSDLVTQTNQHIANGYYHRWGIVPIPEEVKKINQQYALGNKSPLILTDTVDCGTLFPVGFHVTNVEKRVDVKQLTEHFCQAFLANSKQGTVEAFAQSILIDATAYFQDVIKPEDKQSKKRFTKKYDQFLKDITLSIQSAVKELHASTGIEESKLNRIFKKNITTVCRVQVGEIGGIKVIPLFTSLEGADFEKNSQSLINFVVKTGYYVGAVNYRKYILKNFEASKVEYVHPNGKIGILFESPQSEDSFLKPSFLKTECFAEMQRITEDKSQPEYVGILGGAAVALLRGLMSEISEKSWKDLMAHPQKSALLQTCLYKIQVALGDARLCLNNYNRFTQCIEKVHCELASLLALTSPFKEDQFSEILKTTLKKCFPPEALSFMQGGIAKTSMNVYAGVYRAAMENNPNAVRVCSKGSYFEHVDFIGKTLDLDDALKDPNIKIDVYGGMFNPNVAIETEFTHYTERNIAEDIRKILQKNTGKPFTVVIDSTIDYIHSKKSAQLLEEFAKEIAEGKINFVFLRSGQKFDMLNNDNYYASAYYVINNGAEHWKPFEHLFKDKVYKADPLSVQWFCLAYKHAAQFIDDYMGQIFQNHRTLLDSIPEALKPKSKGKSQKVRVSTMERNADPAFIDLKVLGRMHYARAIFYLIRFYRILFKYKVKAQTRSSFGFYHPNINVVQVRAVDDSTTIRINLGLNKKDNAVLLKYFKSLA